MMDEKRLAEIQQRCYEWQDIEWWADEDDDFIDDALEYIPDLLAEVRRLNAQLAMAKDVLEFYKTELKGDLAEVTLKQLNAGE